MKFIHSAVEPPWQAVLKFSLIIMGIVDAPGLNAIIFSLSLLVSIPWQALHFSLIFFSETWNPPDSGGHAIACKYKTRVKNISRTNNLAYFPPAPNQN